MTNTFSPLLTDLYELTMAAGYFENRFNPTATFELFVRQFPANRNYLVYAGLEQALEFVENHPFRNEDIEYLKNLPVFKDVSGSFWDYLKNMTFTGEIWSVKEGEIVFPMEPLLRVTAPIIEAQLLETFLLTTINFQTTIATKASRVYHAARTDGKERVLMEFGSRRAHGPQAGVLAARASYIGGFNGTSNVYAGEQFDIGVYGTAAHSWIMAYRNEMDAFLSYHSVFPDSTILLVDTFNCETGVENAIRVGEKVKGIRIDSGDLLKESILARKKLDDAGRHHVKIVLSGDLDEEKIAALIRQGAPVDAFGVGTQLAVSADAPFLGGIYKLVQTENNDQINYTAKLSTEKQTYPGKKQIIRDTNGDGTYKGDIIALEGENLPGSSLLEKVYETGKRVKPPKSIHQIRDCHLAETTKFGDLFSKPTDEFNYHVKYSDKLKTLFNREAGKRL